MTTQPPPAVPADPVAVRVQHLLVMAVLAGGWGLSLSRPGSAAVLPVVAAVLLAATVHPALSVPRLISLGVLAAARRPRPRLGAPDPTAHRLGRALAGVLLVAASLCAPVSPVAAWTLGWVVVTLALLEFTFDVSVGAVIHTRLRRAGLLRI
jgi:hypothetical protein